ncbi:MAG: spermidine synthase [Brooklawnia sp.]|jgi:spermidine synthase
MTDGAFYLVPDGSGWVVVMDQVAHSWVDPEDPTRLEFGYMLRMADYIDAAAPAGERMRVVHVGGGAMTMARYVAARRPTSPQIVCEPNERLTVLVRNKLPLPANSGIKVRAVDGRTGITEMPDDYARVIIVDAFDDARVPASLVSLEYFAELGRVLHPDGILLFNLIDIHPFDWTRRVLAGAKEYFEHRCLTVEPATLKGRRHGNLLLAASRAALPVDYAIRRAAGSAFPHRVLYGESYDRFAGEAQAFFDMDAIPSPAVERGLRHFS